MKTFSGRRASQNERELAGFTALLQEVGVKSYLEIGARHGDTFHQVMCALPPGSRGVALDLPGGAWGTPESIVALKRAIEDLNQRGYETSAIFGNSANPGTINMAVGRGPYDAILIDGDHSYDAVRVDWEHYGRLAPLIAFHDIVGFKEQESRTKAPVEVPRLWSEIKATGARVVEFIGKGSRMGIGVVWTR